MSYKDGQNVQGSHSPYTVWLKTVGHVVGVDYRELNRYIREYNAKHYNRYFSFWGWYSYMEFGDASYIDGFSALWNDHNENMSQVIPIE